MSIPILCHVFLILFGGFFAIQLAFNSQKFAESSLRMDSPQAGYALKPAGFIMCGVVLMLIATLFGIGGFTGTKELLAVMAVFCTGSVIFNGGQVLKVFPTFDGADHDVKNAIRPLIPLIVIIIYFSTS